MAESGDALTMLKLAAWRLALDAQPSEVLVDLAVEALSGGIDTPALRELAGLGQDDVRGATDMFRQASTELGLDVTPEQALTGRGHREVIGGLAEGHADDWEPGHRPSGRRTRTPGGVVASR